MRSGWRRIGAERWLHLSSNVLVYRLSADQMWRAVIPMNGIDKDADVPLSWGVEPSFALDLAELHALRVECRRNEAHAEALTGVGDETRRARYELLCELQGYGLGAYGKQRIEEYAREHGFALPGMVP